MNSEFNWPLFDQLRARISSLKPEKFDYNIAALDDDGCGCLAAHLKALVSAHFIGGLTLLQRELRVTSVEASFLYGDDVLGAKCVYADESWRAGERGIREALRRLDLVASHYTRPTKPVEPNKFSAVEELADSPASALQSRQEVLGSNPSRATNLSAAERAHLLRCMAVASHPAEVE